MWVSFWAIFAQNVRSPCLWATSQSCSSLQRRTSGIISSTGLTRLSCPEMSWMSGLMTQVSGFIFYPGFLFAIHLQFCKPFTTLQSIYNFAIHLQFCNPFTISQSIYNFAIHLQFCNPFTILQSIYNFAIHLHFKIYLQFCNTFSFYPQSMYNFKNHLTIQLQFDNFQASLHHRANACSCYASNWGRCYHHNFLRYSPIFSEKKLAFLLCYDPLFV
jgi:hypothetical protein